jgi:transposase
MKVSAAAQKLGLSLQTYANWVARSREGKLAAVDAHGMQRVSELQAEVSRLKRELAIACEERDVLKKATAPSLGRAVAALRNMPSEVRLH